MKAQKNAGRANESAQAKSHTISGDNSLRDPPVPIPNTEVKPQHADGIWLETARESRSSPDSIFLDAPASVLFCAVETTLEFCTDKLSLPETGQCTVK